MLLLVRRLVTTVRKVGNMVCDGKVSAEASQGID